MIAEVYQVFVGAAAVVLPLSTGILAGGVATTIPPRRRMIGAGCALIFLTELNLLIMGKAEEVNALSPFNAIVSAYGLVAIPVGLLGGLLLRYRWQEEVDAHLRVILKDSIHQQSSLEHANDAMPALDAGDLQEMDPEDLKQFDECEKPSDHTRDSGP